MRRRIHLDAPAAGQAGFTLIELLVAMTISLVLLAGLYSNFILQSRIQNEQAHRSTLAEDLQLAANIMQRELRMAQAGSIAVDTSNGTKLSYTDVDGNSGFFWYNHPATSSGLLGAGTICWDDPPDDGACDGNEEHVRGLKQTDGMTVTQNGSVWRITFIGEYQDHNGQARDIRVQFDVSPRN